MASKLWRAFERGGIPAILWAYALMLLINYVTRPCFGLNPFPVPGEITALAGTIIVSLLGKKAYQNKDAAEADK